MQGFDGCWSGAIVPRLKSYGRGFQSIICRALRYPRESSPNLCVKYFSQAQVVQGMRMHPCLSTITLEGAVKGAPSAHLEEVPLTASERVIHLTQLLVFVVPLPILLVQQPS